MVIDIREAVPADAGAIASLVETLGYEAEGRPIARRLEQLIGSSRDRVLVAHLHDEPVGFVVVTLAPRFVEDGWFSRVTALAVRPDARRHSVGRLLIEAAERWAARAGSTLMQINCGRRRERQAAHRFYVDLGYEDQYDHHILYNKPLRG